MLPDKQLLMNLIGSVYEAAADATLWEPFLREFAQTCRADSSVLVTRDFDRGLHAVRASWNLDPDADRLYQNYYGSVDEWAMRGRSKPAGFVCASESLCPLGEMSVTEMYNDFMLRYDIEHGIFGVAQNNASGWAGVSLYRGRASDEFGSPELETMDFLIPHIQRAFKLHYQFSEIKALSNGVEAALDLLSVAVIFLSGTAEVLLMNKRAEELVASKDGLLFRAGKFSSETNGESTRLLTLIRGAVETGNGKGLNAGGTILISRKMGRPLSVTVAPLRGFDAGCSRRPAAVLFIFDPDRNLEIPEDLLQRCYGLTRAEARLTMVLLEGRSLKETADCCGVTHNTAKSQLKTIFLKTQVKRQGELIRLLLNSTSIARISQTEKQLGKRIKIAETSCVRTSYRLAPDDISCR
jgi:DNA-binding CsgD family transcriptional regulator